MSASSDNCDRVMNDLSALLEKSVYEFVGHVESVECPHVDELYGVQEMHAIINGEGVRYRVHVFDQNKMYDIQTALENSTTKNWKFTDEEVVGGTSMQPENGWTETPGEEVDEPTEAPGTEIVNFIAGLFDRSDTDKIWTPTGDDVPFAQSEDGELYPPPKKKAKTTRKIEGDDDSPRIISFED